MKNLVYSIGLSTTSGVLLGSLIAACRNKNKFSLGFQMGANWFLCSLPFFTIRDIIIHSSQDRASTTTFKNRSETDLFASCLSGAVLGAGIGWIWRGPLAMAPVGIVHTFGAGIGQSVYTFLDNWRIKNAIALLENHTTNHPFLSSSNHSSPHSSISISTTSPRNYLWYQNVDSAVPISPSTLTEDQYQYKDWKEKFIESSNNADKDAFFLDPIKIIYDSIASLVTKLTSLDSQKEGAKVDDEWEWIRNATNVEYRKKLSFKVIILKEQIIELRKELEKRGIEHLSAACTSGSPPPTTDQTVRN